MLPQTANFILPSENVIPGLVWAIIITPRISNPKA